MTKLAISQYELRSRSPVGVSAGVSRRGALLRVEFPGLGFGYADVHPWAELGDEPLDAQLALLREGKDTSLTRRSFMLARRDAEARSRGINLFSDSQAPMSHVLAGNALELSGIALRNWSREGFSFVKVKAGRSAEEESRHLRELSRIAADLGMKLRIDLNEALSEAEAYSFFDRLSSGAGADGVDFVEDPVAFEPAIWRSLKTQFPIRLAVDRAGSRLISEGADAARCLDVFVLKPAIQDPEAAIDWVWKNSVRLVVTSYLDHPLGTAGAVWHAIQAREQLSGLFEAGGWMTHLNYEENDFSVKLQREGSRWIPPNGSGFGFDTELERTQWLEIS